jgi:hypothetical protein
MLINTATVTTNKPATYIWDKYKDVQNWNQWDQTVESSEIFGEFSEGTKGKLKPVDGPEADFQITTMTKYIYFSNRSRLPFGFIEFEHSIADDGVIRTITHTINIGGFSAPLFSLILGKTLSKGLAETMINLVS